MRNPNPLSIPPGYGAICTAELAGEIGTIARFRGEAKRHNQAIRALGRYLCRVIFKRLTQDRSVSRSIRFTLC